jgi:hypothetical protein
LASLLLVALLTAQTLGLLHREVHAGVAVSHGPSRIQPGSPVAELQALFAHRHDSAECKLFDQLSHNDAVVHSDLGTPGLPSAALDTAGPTGRHVAAQAAGYLARGPPLTV